MSLKHGFSLLELVISLSIAVIVSVALTAFLNQTRTYQTAVGDRVSIYIRASSVLNQFEKDIMGVYVPIENSEFEKQKKDKKGQQPSLANQSSASAKSLANKSVNKKEKETKKKQVKRVEHVFFAEQPNKELALFSCITSNPLQVYWSKQVGSAKPKIARVVYTLVPDKQQKDSFVLMRQEGTELDLKPYKGEGSKIRAYELIDGIKSCSLIFILVTEPGTDDVEKKQDVPQERKIEEKTAWDWPLKEEDAKDKEKKYSESPFPTYVTMHLELWDERFERATEFDYTVPIVVDGIQTPEQEKSSASKTKDKLKDKNKQDDAKENKTKPSNIGASAQNSQWTIKTSFGGNLHDAA